MAQVAMTCDEKNFSFSLRSKSWGCMDISKLLGEDVKCSIEKVDFVSAVNDGELVCTIICANEKIFRQMKSELERVLD